MRAEPMPHLWPEGRFGSDGYTLYRHADDAIKPWLFVQLCVLCPSHVLTTLSNTTLPGDVKMLN